MTTDRAGHYDIDGVSYGGDQVIVGSAKKGSDEKAPKIVTEKVRYAVVGLGYIAQAAVLPAFRNAKENSELVALISGDLVKARELQKIYKVPYVGPYENFEETLIKAKVHVVYICLPNFLHRQYSERASRIGVNVLCEKPMAVSPADCQVMSRVAKLNNVKLMVAYRLHFNEAHLSSIALIASGKIGHPRIFRSSFSLQVTPGNIRLNPVSLGGGPVYDLGIYCINAARYLFREEPSHVFARQMSSPDDSRFAETPEMVSVIMSFPNEKLAEFVVSFGCQRTSSIEVIGTKGKLYLENAYSHSEDIECTWTTEEKRVRKIVSKRDQFAPQLVYFSNCILNGVDPEPSGAEGTMDVQIIQKIHESAVTRQPVELFERKRHLGPSVDQAIFKPHQKAPKLIRANYASLS